ncbi:MAG: MFS transporter [Alphaproteobacteria bacterium]|nr:MFS transporter [Alphaproteobacteria bacterium]
MEAVAGFPKREVQAIGLIGFAHMLSHLYWLALAPLAPSMIDDMQITAVDWGLALGAFSVTTGIFQTPMGLLVERVGGRRVLIGGLLLTAVAVFAIGAISTSYWSLIALMAIAGIGNSVFHPADYSLLNASIDEKRIGRAFSLHNFSGQIGFIVGPILTVALEPFLGWRGAIMVLGVIGMIMTVLLIIYGGTAIIEGNKVKKQSPIMDSLRDLVTSKPVMLFFIFYVCSSLGNFGVTQFSVLAFQPMYGLEKVAVVAALTAYQIGTLILIIPGGMLADKVERYDIIMLAGFGLAASATFLVGTGVMPFWLVVGTLCLAGAMRGGVNATRDVAVRRVIEHLPVGTVFAFVSTGFTVGQAFGGAIYGYLFDNYPPNYIFYVSALFTMIGASTVLLNAGTRKARAT